MQDLVLIDSKNTKSRVFLAAAIIIAFGLGWVAVRWQLGNLLANLTSQADPNAAEIADLSAAWAPSDPAAVWLKAATTNNLRVYEEAVRLAPNDYRWRVELGRAYEQDGQPERAESQFKRAAELAPAYAFPRWHLGNFHLRQNRLDEAVIELKIAAANNGPYRDQVFSLAWDYFEKDAARVENLGGDKPEARARLAYFFAARGRADDSIRNWNYLSETDKAATPQIAKAISHGLFIQRHFPQSLEFARQLGIDPDVQPESVTNASFEKGLDESPDSRFGWKIVRNDSKTEINIDQKVKREGNRGLRISFRNYVKSELYNIFQTVVVEPNRKYALRFWVRTENLKSAGPPLLEVVDANNDRLLANSSEFASGTNDWQEFSVEFVTPANCSGINIRTARSFCGEECPLTGIFWYDDFVLLRRGE